MALTITYTSTSFMGGGIGVMIMFTLVSLFLAVYFSHIDRKNKEARESFIKEQVKFNTPQAPENILMISFCWFMFVVSSYLSLLFILSTGELGNNIAYTMTTLYTLMLVIIFIYLLVKYKDVFVNKLREWGLI